MFFRSCCLLFSRAFLLCAGPGQNDSDLFQVFVFPFLSATLLSFSILSYPFLSFPFLSFPFLDSLFPFPFRSSIVLHLHHNRRRRDPRPNRLGETVANLWTRTKKKKEKKRKSNHGTSLRPLRNLIDNAPNLVQYYGYESQEALDRRSTASLKTLQSCSEYKIIFHIYLNHYLCIWSWF